MHFTHSSHPSSNTTRLAAVVVFHVLLGIALVKTMNVRQMTRSAEPPPVTVVPTFTPPVPPPQPVDVPVSSLPAPRIFVPEVAVPVATPPVPNTVTTTTTVVTDPAPPVHDVVAVNPPQVAPAQIAPGTGVRMAAMMDGCAQPVYPAQAARNGNTGTVTLALLIGVDGRVTSSRVAHSTGFRDLDKAALTALSRCTFKPAMHGDIAEAGWAQIAFVWTLE